MHENGHGNVHDHENGNGRDDENARGNDRENAHASANCHDGGYEQEPLVLASRCPMKSRLPKTALAEKLQAK